ncbi:hypothetical protein LJC42_03605, partial [Eubacteriales bacterium OttesenSCG-928-K08]|nr:hypothetical protein [Eubacteriales bacterium OttesenSCG-928-K08]
IKITLAWEDNDANSNTRAANSGLSTDNIEVAQFLNIGATDMWLDAGDGYYYYKGILKPGEVTSQALFEKFRLNEKTGNEYRGKTANIVVHLDCLQAAGNALSNQWGIQFSALGIAPPAVPVADATTVTFVNRRTGFTFNPTSTDLFANFKNLVPGETREQRINVSNTSSDVVNIYLRAEYVDQTLATTANIDLVNEMLQKYATVTIKDSSGKLIYEGAVWGNYPNEPTTGKMDSMRNNINLGRFRTGDTLGMTVSLTLDPQLDNRYQDLWGRIKWVFSAMGDDDDDGPIITPPVNPNDPDYEPDGDIPLGTPSDDLEDDGIPLGMPETGTQTVSMGILICVLVLGLVVMTIVKLIRRKAKSRS